MYFDVYLSPARKFLGEIFDTYIETAYFQKLHHFLFYFQISFFGE